MILNVELILCDLKCRFVLRVTLFLIVLLYLLVDMFYDKK